MLGEALAAVRLDLHFPPPLLEELGRVDVLVHVLVRRAQLAHPAGLRLLGPEVVFRPRPRRRMDGVVVDQPLDRERGVQEVLDGLLAVALQVAAHPGPVVRHLVDHVPVGLAEPHVVLEEVAVAVDVGDDHLLVHERVRPHQVGVTRVVVDDEFVDLRQPVRVALVQLLVFHPEPPVRQPGGEAAVRGHLVHLVVGDELEDRPDRVETVLDGVAEDLVLDRPEAVRLPVALPRRAALRRFSHAHFPLPRKSRIES